MDSTTLVGSQILKAREASGLSTAQLAKRVGVNESTLLNWESDRSSPRANRLVQLAGILGVPVIWLMAGDEEDITEFESPNLKETASIESKLEKAEQLLQQLSSLVVDIRAQTRRVQRELDFNDGV